MLPELTKEDLSQALDSVVQDILATAGVIGPPVEARQVAEALRLSVSFDDSQLGRARFVRLKHAAAATATGSILLRSEPRPERRQWAIAHEIGEQSAARVFAALSVDPREAPASARETVANQLAGRLLVPSAWFRRDARRCGWGLPILKECYATASHELIARRMLDDSPPVIITIFDHARMTFRRGNLPNRLPPPSAVERECWRRAHESGRPQHCEAGLEHVQAWPIHEPDWKREILRTERESEGCDEMP